MRMELITRTQSQSDIRTEDSKLQNKETKFKMSFPPLTDCSYAVQDSVAVKDSVAPDPDDNLLITLIPDLI